MQKPAMGTNMGTLFEVVPLRDTKRREFIPILRTGHNRRR